jgi:hypothetical protein
MQLSLKALFSLAITPALQLYPAVELKREGDLWRDVSEFIALFSKAKHGDPYRVEFRLVERLI